MGADHDIAMETNFRGYWEAIPILWSHPHWRWYDLYRVFGSEVRGNYAIPHVKFNEEKPEGTSIYGVWDFRDDPERMMYSHIDRWFWLSELQRYDWNYFWISQPQENRPHNLSIPPFQVMELLESARIAKVPVDSVRVVWGHD